MGGIISNNVTTSNFIFYQKLGKGEFGEVILIKNIQSSQYFAVKEINLLKVFDSGVKPLMLQHELYALKRLQSHPFITELHYSFIENNYCYIVLEYLNGGTLRDLLYIKYLFTEKQIAFLIGCISAGLAYIHSRGIIHRDIKPENIVLDCKGYPHIADFGISYVDTSYPLNTKPITCRMTSGTEQYCAPECLAQPHDHGIEVDYWSLGIMTYELFFQMRPYKSRVPKLSVKYVESLRKSKSSSEDIFGSGFQTKSSPDTAPSSACVSPMSPLKSFNLLHFWGSPSSEEKNRNNNHNNNNKSKPVSTPHHPSNEGSNRSLTWKYEHEHSISFSFAAILNRTNRVAISGGNGGSVRVANPSHRVIVESRTVEASAPPLRSDENRQNSLRPNADNLATSSVNHAITQTTQFHNQIQLNNNSPLEEIICPKCSDTLPFSLTVPLPPAQYYIHTKREKPTESFVSMLGMLLDIRPNHRIGHNATQCLPGILEHPWFSEHHLPIATLQSLATGNSFMALNFGDLPGLPLTPSPLPTHLVRDQRQATTSTLKRLLPNKKLKQLRKEIGDYTFISSRYCSKTPNSSAL